MPTIKLTWNQLYRLSDMVEMEAEALRKYPCDDPSVLTKTARLRDRIYNQIEQNGKEV